MTLFGNRSRPIFILLKLQKKKKKKKTRLYDVAMQCRKALFHLVVKSDTHTSRFYVTFLPEQTLLAHESCCITYFLAI